MAAPKNIKQIGEPESGHRIYIEDYVYTYLHTTEKQTDSGRQPAILVGTRGTEGQENILYISGAISMEVLEYDNGRIIISEQAWSEVYSQCKSYYDRKEILGWFYPVPEKRDNLLMEIERAHRIYFPGNDKILFLGEWEDQEESIYRVSNGIFSPQKGYYIYYEKNPQMQEYMLTRKASKTVEDDRKEIMEMERQTDRAVARYREIVANQIRREQAFEKMRRVAVGVFALMFMGVFTYFMYTGYGRVEYLTQLVGQLETALGITRTEDKETQSVEMVQGEVTADGDESEEEETPDSAVSDEEEKPDDTMPDEDGEIQEDGKTDEDGEIQEDSVPDQDEQIPEDSEPDEDGENAETDTENEAEQESDESTATGNDVENNNETDDKSETEETAANPYQEQGYYIVQQGDNLEAICRKIYSSNEYVKALCEENDIDNPDEIYEGQKLILP